MSTGYNQIKSIIGLCPQEIVIWEQLTCLEQLKFVGMSYGLSSRLAGKKAEDLLEKLGLEGKRNKLAGTLSGGMQRRLNIALALIHDPELIILDEPQAGLDPQSRILVRDFIRQLAKLKTIILTTHDMDEADRLSDRVAIMDHGKILTIDTPQMLKEKSGMGDIIQVRVADLSKEEMDNLLHSIPPQFTEKKYSDGFLLLGANDVLELIPLVNKTLRSLNIHIEDLTIRKRTLEDTFITLTGRGLRE
ncbi:Daunorubicin/doxorubicin resistance ATP-binding protein DrrA [compost metagenome]